MLLVFLFYLLTQAHCQFLDIEEVVNVPTSSGEKNSIFGLRDLSFLNTAPIQENENVAITLSISTIGVSSINLVDNAKVDLALFNRECFQDEPRGFRCRNLTLGDPSLEKIEKSFDQFFIIFRDEIEVIFTVDGFDNVLNPVQLVQNALLLTDYQYVGFILGIICVSLLGLYLIGPATLTLHDFLSDLCDGFLNCVDTRRPARYQYPARNTSTQVTSNQDISSDQDTSYQRPTFRTVLNHEVVNRGSSGHVFSDTSNYNHDRALVEASGNIYGVAVPVPVSILRTNRTAENEYIIDTGPPIDVGSVAQVASNGTETDDTHAPLASNY